MHLLSPVPPVPELISVRNLRPQTLVESFRSSFIHCYVRLGLWFLWPDSAKLHICAPNMRINGCAQRTTSSARSCQNLNNRVEAVEDTSRKLAAEVPAAQHETAGHARPGRSSASPVDSAAALAAFGIKDCETRTRDAHVRIVPPVARDDPFIWPVTGKLESGVGGRRNPFGGRGYDTTKVRT